MPCSFVVFPVCVCLCLYLELFFFSSFLQNVDKKVETKKEAMKLSGIGKSIGEKVEEFAQTGKLAMMEDLFGAGQEGKIEEEAKKLAEEKEKGMAFTFMD
mmetsp:Transcript_35323/g.76683  ORF Transcript_35323/g.76683 Transcript_35323/m.76683 type:complete len:100 (-) Transcript_35323:98-397(-)